MAVGQFLKCILDVSDPASFSNFKCFVVFISAGVCLFHSTIKIISICWYSNLNSVRMILLNDYCPIAPFFTTFLLVHSRSAHLFSIFFYIGGAIFKFVAVLQCMRNITSGESNMRKVGMNTSQNELCTRM